jgi:hypothetical protein
MRFTAVILTTLLLGGCATAVQNPKTGEIQTCSQGVLDISPWSQDDACTANHIAQGWTVAANH